MTDLRTVWLGGEPVAIPEEALVVHLDGERLALIATPVWRVHVLTSEGVVEAPAERSAELLAAYFPNKISATAKEDFRTP